MNLWNLWIAEDFEQFWRSPKGFYTWNSMTRSKGFGVFFFKSWLWLTLVKTYIWEFSWKSVLAMPCKKKDSGCVVAITIVSDYQIILVQATSRHKHNRIFKERWAWTGGKNIIHLIYNIILFPGCDEVRKSRWIFRSPHFVAFFESTLILILKKNWNRARFYFISTHFRKFWCKHHPRWCW